MAEKETSKYMVLKRDDIDTFLSVYDRVILERLVGRINECRESEGKSKNDYILCNQDEPYAEKVWQAILDGEDNK